MGNEKKCMRITVSGASKGDINRSVSKAKQDLASMGYSQDLEVKPRKGHTIVKGCRP